MEVIINVSPGWFGFSEEFLERYPEFKTFNYENKHERINPDLIKAIKNFGIYQAEDTFSDLRIVKLPNDISDFSIEDCDGYEWIVYAQNGRIHHAYGEEYEKEKEVT